MKLFKSLFGSDSESRFADIGNLDAVCPYCGNSLKTKPRSKKKCPHCGEHIYVMSRPSDGKRILLTADEKQRLSRERARHHDLEHMSPEWKRAYNKAWASLERQCGFAPEHGDVQWRVLNQLVFSQPPGQKGHFLGHDALNALKRLRQEGKLEIVEEALLKSEPTPAVADELRKTLSAKASLARKKQDWASVVENLERYLAYADRWRAYCLALVNAEPPPLGKRDAKLLKKARRQIKGCARAR